MAQGTGLPLPKTGNVLTQAQPIVDGDKYSSAAAWTRIAAEGQQLANTAADFSEMLIKQQEARHVAESELEDARWFTDNRDAFQHNPAGFDAAARGYMEGKLAETPSWDYTRRKRFLGGKMEGTYATILSETRSRDTRLANEALVARAKSADNDLMALAAAGKIGTPEWQASEATYNSVLETSVATGLMTGEKAQLLREDFQARAQGEYVSRKGVEIYRQSGAQAANDFIRKEVLENEGLSVPVGKRYQIANRALSQVRLAQAEDKADRAVIVETARDLQKRIVSNQDVDPGEVHDTLAALQRSGAMAQHARLSRDFAVRQATEPYRSGTVPLGQFGRQVARLRGEDAVLIRQESGNDPAVVNRFGYAGLYQFGAPRLQTLGVYRAGANENLETWSRTGRDEAGKWTGTFNIPGHPEVRTLEDFRRNPAAQRTVRELDVRRMDEDAAKTGLERFIGQTVGGVPITREGLRNMMHLGGVGGARRFLESDGRDNVPDRNGMTVGDYARLGARTSASGDPSLPQDGAVVAAVQAELVKQAKSAWPQFRDMIARGHAPETEDFAAIRYAAQVSGDANWQREVDGLAGAALLGAAGRNMTEAQRKVALDELTRTIDQSGWTADRERVFQSIKTQFERQSKEVHEDPVGFGARMQGVKVEPLNLGDGAAAMAGLQQRMQIARGVAAAQGVPVASPFRAIDIEMLAGAIQSGQGAGTAFALLNVLPEDMLGATLDAKGLKDAIRGAALSTDPGRIDTAMKGLDQLAAHGAVSTVKQFGSDVWHRLKTWQSNLRYLSPDRMAEELRRYADPEERKKAEAPARAALKERSNDDIVKAFDASWSITPNVVARNVTSSQPLAPTDETTVAALRSDYDTIFIRRYRELNGDADKAHEQTVELMKERWARSGVNGGRLMLRAPEQNYPAVNGSHDWMRAQIEKDLEAKLGPRYAGRALDEALGTGYASWSYTLVADRTTEAEATSPGRLLSEFDRRPYKPPVSYLVVVTDHKTGRSDIARDGERPMRYRFDPAASQEKARARFGVLREQAMTQEWAATLADSRRPFAVP